MYKKLENLSIGKYDIDENDTDICYVNSYDSHIDIRHCNDENSIDINR